MPRKKIDPSLAQLASQQIDIKGGISEPTELTFKVVMDNDCESDRLVQCGRFSRNWEEEDPLDVLLDELESGRVSDQQALMRARKLEMRSPGNLEIQNFIANRLWALGSRDEAMEVYERAFRRAKALIPDGFKGLIRWVEIDNRSFLRVAHGTLLGLMDRRDCEEALQLAQQMLAWCPDDNLGVGFLLPDISHLMRDYPTALRQYLRMARGFPQCWYQAALIAFREADYVRACTYLRRGIIGNPYIAEGLTGRTVLTEHLYWHGSSLHGPHSAIEYLESAGCDWTPEEMDFVDWVFNAAPVLKERGGWMALQEALTGARAPDERGPIFRQQEIFFKGIDSGVSKKMVRKVRNRWGNEVWPWDRQALSRPASSGVRAA